MTTTECHIDTIIDSLTKIISGKACFSSGAFVIHDPHHKIFNSLNTPQCKSYPRPGGFTHNVFMNNTKFSQKRTAPKANDISLVEPDKTTQREIYSTSISWCGDIPKTTILFYPFKIKYNGKPLKEERQFFKNAEFLYLKLEAFPVWHIGHVKDAINRYYMPKQISKTITRRENSRSNKPYTYLYHDSDIEIYKNNLTKNINLKKIMKDFKIYNTYLRATHEFFIPDNIL
jgi:hypothetical protein